MKEDVSDKFEFLSEIQKENNYKLLFPEQKVGLAIIWLYNKSITGVFENNTFKESDIHDALETFNVRSENKDTRHPKERYSTIITELQEYFLRYDDEDRSYKFKEYALTFCSYAFKTLKANFDPTQIELICLDLRKKLDSASTANDVLNWFKLHFSTFKPALREQVDYLDRQIDKSIAELRQNSLTESRKITNVLKQIDSNLDLIRQQNKELRAAFRELEAIKVKLVADSMNNENTEIGDLTYHAISFVQEMKHLLSLIDRRLDRIQPKIKQLFSNLNKPLFSSRIEKFLRILLDKSDVITDGSRKLIVLPGGIPSISRFPARPKFTIFERKKDLFPSIPKQRLQIQENVEKKQKAYEVFTNRFVQQDDVSKWIEIIRLKLETVNSIGFSELFFQILRSKDNSLDLAIAVTFKVIKEANLNNWNLTIEPKVRNNQNGIGIWEMTIAQKNLH